MTPRDALLGVVIFLVWWAVRYWRLGRDNPDD
jgi:hypothetical protein